MGDGATYLELLLFSKALHISLIVEASAVRIVAIFLVPGGRRATARLTVLVDVWLLRHVGCLIWYDRWLWLSRRCKSLLGENGERHKISEDCGDEPRSRTRTNRNNGRGNAFQAAVH